jgi:excisionase family DNA binding protein
MSENARPVGHPPKPLPETLNSTHEVLAFNVTDAARAIGVGRGKIHELISQGRLASTLVGGRRIIPRVSLEQLIANGERPKVGRGLNAAEAGRASGAKRAEIAAERAAEAAEAEAAFLEDKAREAREAARKAREAITSFASETA